MLVFILFLSLSVGFFIWAECQKKNQEELNKEFKILKEKYEKIESYVSYEAVGSDSYGLNLNTLYLKKRDPLIAEVVYIFDDSDQLVKYVPKEYTLTSVTVGGITTGGVSEYGGFNNIVGEVKNGKAVLDYSGFDQGLQRISKIQLTTSLFREAKKSKLIDPKWLDSTRKQIIVIDETKSAAAMLMSSRLSTTSPSGNFMLEQAAQKVGYPSREKCQRILDWLCGIDE